MAFEEVVTLDGGDPLKGGVGELCIRIRELPMADGVHASTGCQLWSSSIALAQELLSRPNLVSGKEVLEVGAGCGLLGITAARLARRTLITDGDEEVVQNLAYNLQANEATWRAREGEPQREAAAKQMRWEEPYEEPWPDSERVEVILGSDIIYGHWGDVVAQALQNMLRPGGLILLATAEDRRSGLQAFQDCLQTANFRIVEKRLLSHLGEFRLYECQR